MSIPSVYKPRKVNPLWIHYWKLAHTDHTGIVFSVNYVSPIPYCDQEPEQGIDPA